MFVGHASLTRSTSLPKLKKDVNSNLDVVSVHGSTFDSQKIDAPAHKHHKAVSELGDHQYEHSFTSKSV